MFCLNEKKDFNLPQMPHFTLSQVVPKLNQKGKDLIQVKSIFYSIEPKEKCLLTIYLFYWWLSMIQIFVESDVK